MTLLELFLVGLLLVMVYLLFEACERSAKYKALAESFAEQIENQAKIIRTQEGQLKIRRRLLDVQHGRIKGLEAQLKAARTGAEMAERMEDDGK